MERGALLLRHTRRLTRSTDVPLESVIGKADGLGNLEEHALGHEVVELREISARFLHLAPQLADDIEAFKSLQLKRVEAGQGEAREIEARCSLPNASYLLFQACEVGACGRSLLR